MSNKRSSLKGKGADIYLASEERSQEAPLSQQGSGTRRKATFYVPSDLLDQLDDAWLDLRRIDRGVARRSFLAPSTRHLSFVLVFFWALSVLLPHLSSAPRAAEPSGMSGCACLFVSPYAALWLRLCVVVRGSAAASFVLS